MNIAASIAESVSALILAVAGIYFTVRLSFFQFHPVRIIKELFSGKGRKSIKEIFSYFSASLAGAVGTGNIIGVAAALYIGGPGSIFWMWVAGILGMATKYAEAYIAANHRRTDHGYNSSPMEYIRLGTKSRAFPKAFAFFGVLSAFSMGNLMQSNAACSFLSDIFPSIPSMLLGIVISLLVLCVTVGGLKRITQLFNFLIPITTIVYILTCLISVFSNIENVSKAIGSIFMYAFAPSAAIGGTFGAALSLCIKTGVVKGLMSNEAGMGSAGLAYANSESSTPHEQGLWAALDVFTDTILISTITALAILTSPGGGNGDEMSLLESIFATLGCGGEIAITVCTMIFAISSIITWSYYGEACLAYITKGKYINIYRLIFAVFSIFGAITVTSKIWIISEIINSGMLAVNMLGIAGIQKQTGRRGILHRQN